MRRKISRIPRSIKASPRYFFKRTAVGIGIDPTTTSMQLFNPLLTYNFTLNNVPTASEFKNLFSLYKIHAIKVKFYGNVDTNVTGELGPTINAVQYSWYDPTRSNVNPTTITELQQYQNLRITRLQRRKAVQYYFKPRIVDEVQSTPGVSTSAMYHGRKAGWLDTSKADVRHYGPHIAWEKLDSTFWDTPEGDPMLDSIKFKMFVTYYLEFKIPR